MLLSKTRWVVRDSNKQLEELLANQLKISPLVASLLINRGIETEQEARFFLFDDGQHYHDPYLMNDMEIAVERIKKAISNGEKILVFGDYDADGVTSTALLMTTLQDLNASVDFYIPNRFSEGYGLNGDAIIEATENDFSLIITVDTGISSIEEVELANELGIDIIITDHHEPKHELPNAYAIVHPLVGSPAYPFGKLAGAGVAFKLAHALYEKVPTHLLDYAAIGTIADLVSLTGENRLIAKQGLQMISGINRVGIQSLCKIANLNVSELDEESIGFGIAPRLNAVGRLDQADRAVHLLLSTDTDEANMLAEEIEQLNKERQTIVKNITEEALLLAEQEIAAGKDVIVIGQPTWHEGVIGIVASRLVEKFNRPAIILAIDENTGIAKGSGRSIPKFDLFKNLTTLGSYLLKFGGHPMAAGLSIEVNEIAVFKNELNKLITEQLTEDDFIPITNLDTTVLLENISVETIEQLNLLAPYGMDNPKPKVLIEGVEVGSMRKIGTNKNHLKMVIKNDNNQLDIVGFGKGYLHDKISPDARLAVIGELAINEWNNTRIPQLFLKDVEIKHWQLFDIRGNNQDDIFEKFVPTENRIWIVFDEQTIEKLNIKSTDTIHLIKTIEEAKEVQLLGNVIFADLPESMEIFNALIENKSYSCIYTYFFKEDSDYFSVKPTREHFKWYYGFLMKRKSFDLVKHRDALAKHCGLSVETLNFMSKVFFELEFITVSKGILTVNENVEKRDLSESESYRMKQEQSVIEQKLLYSTYNDLKNLFTSNELIEENCKEATAQWI